MKVFLGILMVFTGLFGFAMTACGIVFLPASGAGLIGIIPGVLVLCFTKILWDAYKRQDAAPGAPPVPQKPPDQPPP